LTSLAEAAKIAWPDMTDADYTALYDRLTRLLATGTFHFVIVAQRLTQSMMTTASYLNEVSGRASPVLPDRTCPLRRRPPGGVRSPHRSQAIRERVSAPHHLVPDQAQRLRHARQYPPVPSEIQVVPPRA
jgi:hypothetical protein